MTTNVSYITGLTANLNLEEQVSRYLSFTLHIKVNNSEEEEVLFKFSTTKIDAKFSFTHFQWKYYANDDQFNVLCDLLALYGKSIDTATFGKDEPLPVVYVDTAKGVAFSNPNSSDDKWVILSKESSNVRISGRYYTLAEVTERLF